MKIFFWSDKAKWLNEAAEYGQQTLTESVLTSLRQDPPVGFWSDDLSWFPRPEAELELAGAFTGYYTHIQAYHACRPTNVSSYYRHGLVGQNPELVVADFRTIFADVDDDLLDRAIDAMSHRGDAEKGEIYFACSRDHLVDDCGHYLIQGSEYMMSLAARLCEYCPLDEDYRLRLRQIGIPTVFEANLPVNYIPELQLQALMKVIIAEWAYSHIPHEDHGEDEMCFVLHRDLEPEYISSHYHPSQIPDPHFRCQPFVNSFTQCEFCTTE